MNSDRRILDVREDSRGAHSSERLSLDAIFQPHTVALIGATSREGSVGQAVLANLLSSSSGQRIYPVNPKYREILGRPAFASIAKVPEAVDLAIIVTPARTVPGLVRECVDAKVRSTVVISAGFREHGKEGAALESQIREVLRGGRLRLVGPNCLGIMNPLSGLNATFAQTMARPGNVAFLSQSGALLTAILGWSLTEHVGFSAIASTGSMLDVGWGDLIDYFGDDPHTQSILIYMESIGDARSFVSAAREVAMKKPIIVIKAGRTEAASKAAASHTGAMTGSDEVFDAALRRCGVLRVRTISDLFDMAEVLSKQPRPRGPRLMILTNAGGPGVLATDTLIANGGELAVLSEDSLQSLDRLLPPQWSHGNPIDILGDADPERYSRALDIAIRDPSGDGVLAVLAPQRMTDPARVAEQFRPYIGQAGKPLFASWMGGKEVEEGKAILGSYGIPTFAYPEKAVRAFNYMWRYTYHLHGLYETPAVADDPTVATGRRQRAGALLDSMLERGRTLLTEFEAKEILALYDIPIVPTHIARSAEEAATLAERIGFPIAVKLHSEVITHKTDVGGVKLNLETPEAVRTAYESIQSSVEGSAGAGSFQGVTVQPMVRNNGYELILGSSVDPQFGPVLLFGSGGEFVEVYRDRALGLPPLNTTLAQRLMEQTKIYGALRGFRGREPVDMQLLENLLVRFSYIPVELPRIKEIEINPLLASAAGLMVLDARIVLHDRSLADAALPRPAIRPYPTQYISRTRMKNGQEVLIRPIRPEDEPLIARFHESLSDQTVYLRYFHMETLSSRVAHERLLRKCFIDYEREIALVVEATDSASNTRNILAVGRLTRDRDPRRGEVAILVTDRVQHLGLGTELLSRLVEIARHEKFELLAAHILVENTAMRALTQRFGFVLERTLESGEATAVCIL